MSNCGACGRRIMWVRTRNAKMLPLDPEPNPDGNVVLRDTLTGVDVVVLGPKARLASTETKWMPHHASCPKWSKRR